MEALKVSARSNPNSVAGAMAGVLRRTRAVEVLVVGAAALNQAMKAVAIARTHVQADGLDAVCIPSFVDVDIDGEQRTGILLRIEHRPATVLDLRERSVRPGPPPPAGGVGSTYVPPSSRSASGGPAPSDVRRSSAGPDASGSHVAAARTPARDDAPDASDAGTDAPAADAPAADAGVTPGAPTAAPAPAIVLDETRPLTSGT